MVLLALRGPHLLESIDDKEQGGQAQGAAGKLAVDMWLLGGHCWRWLS